MSPRIIDVSLPIGQSLLTWPGDPPLEINPGSRIAEGASANVSELRMGTHTGTHVDPPLHFLEGGDPADELPLEVLIGECVVADLRGCKANIGAEELEGLGLLRTTRLLFKTLNSKIWEWGAESFPEQYVALTPEGAEWVIQRGIRLVGTDFLSIEARGAPGHPTHTTLLKAGVVILEGLNLAEVEPGAYELICLPLRIQGGDGAPARAVLVER